MFSFPVIIVLLIFNIIGTRTQQYDVQLVDGIVEVKTVCDLDAEYLLNTCKEIIESSSYPEVQPVEGETIGVAKMYSFRPYEKTVSACKCPTKPGIYLVNSPILFGNAVEVQFVLIEKPELKIVKSDGIGSSSSSSPVSKPDPRFIHPNSDTDSRDDQHEHNQSTSKGGGARHVRRESQLPNSRSARSAARTIQPRTLKPNEHGYVSNGSRSERSVSLKNMRADGSGNAMRKDVKKPVKPDRDSRSRTSDNGEPSRINAEDLPPILNEYLNGPQEDILKEVIHEETRGNDENLPETSAGSSHTSTASSDQSTMSRGRNGRARNVVRNPPTVKVNVSMNVSADHYHYYNDKSNFGDGRRLNDSSRRNRHNHEMVAIEEHHTSERSSPLDGGHREDDIHRDTRGEDADDQHAAAEEDRRSAGSSVHKCKTCEHERTIDGDDDKQ